MGVYYIFYITYHINGFREVDLYSRNKLVEGAHGPKISDGNSLP